MRRPDVEEGRAVAVRRLDELQALFSGVNAEMSITLDTYRDAVDKGDFAVDKKTLERMEKIQIALFEIAGTVDEGLDGDDV